MLHEFIVLFVQLELEAIQDLQECNVNIKQGGGQILV